MFCYIRRDLSAYLQLSLCLSALLNWGQQFSSPSVSLTLTVPDIQEIQTGAAVVTYQQNFSLHNGAVSILQRGPRALGGRARSPQAPPCPHHSPSLGIPTAPPVGRQKTQYICKSLWRPSLEIYHLFYCFSKMNVFFNNVLHVHQGCLLSLCLFSSGWWFFKSREGRIVLWNYCQPLWMKS